MKRLVALCLSVVFIALCFVSCSGNLEDKGAIIPIYLTQRISNLDPTARIYDKDVFKYTTLLFEGLTVVDEKGKVSAGLAEEWKTDFNDERGEYFIEFTLKDTHWSDGRALLADHFVYAWKRILSPATSSDAACLLYDIKNAAKVKSGEMTPDALGVSAPNRFTLRVELEKEIDIDLFLEAVASPALVPLRYDVVDEKPNAWATTSEDLLACGPFAVSNMISEEYLLSKSSNYLLSTDPDEKENPKKYVKPQSLYIDYTTSTVDNWGALLEDELHYLDVEYLPDSEEDLTDYIKVDDLLATATCFMDNTHPLLSDKNVRLALSLALDRAAASEKLGYAAYPATGFVSYGVFDTKNKSSFREEGGDLIAEGADVAAAQNLLSGKSLSEEIVLTFRTSEQTALAEYLQSAWKSLGFNITLNGVSDTAYEKALNDQEFDMILLDFQGLSTSAYSFLMPFARSFSGNYVDIDGEFTTPHMTGFDNEAYNALADKVHAATTRKERVELLHEMEELLLSEMPIIPISFWSNCYAISDDVKGLEFNGFGVCVFNDASIKKYKERNILWEEQYAIKEEARKAEEENSGE